MQDERGLYELELRLKKDLNKLEAVWKNERISAMTSGSGSPTPFSPKTEKIRTARTELLVDLAVIESFRYSKHEMMMEIVRGRQPKSLLKSTIRQRSGQPDGRYSPGHPDEERQNNLPRKNNEYSSER